jgi:hypothetical protein
MDGFDTQTTNRGVYYDNDLGYFTSEAAERRIAELRSKYPDWEITPMFTEVTDSEGQVNYAEPITGFHIKKAIEGGLLDLRLLDEAGNETYREIERERGFLQSPVVGILASAVVPGLGEFFAAQLAAAGALTGTMATTVGNALAKIAVDVATGKDLEDAVRDVALSTAISTAMPNLGPSISELVDDPNIAKILTNAGNAAVTAAVQGRDIDEVVTAAVAAGAGTAAAFEGGATAGRAVQSLIISGGDPQAALAAVGGSIAGTAGQALAQEIRSEGISRLPGSVDVRTGVQTLPNLQLSPTGFTVQTTGQGGNGAQGGASGQAAVDPNNQDVLIAQQFLPAGVRIQTFNQLEAVRVLSQANPNLLASMSQGALNEAAGYILNNRENELASVAAARSAGQGLGLVPREANVFTVETLPQDMGEAFTESNGAVYFQEGGKTYRVASQDELARNLGEITLFFDDKGRAYHGKEVIGVTGKFQTDAEKQADLQAQYVADASESIDPETGQPLLLTPGTGQNIGGDNIFRFITAASAKGIGEQLGYVATLTGNNKLEQLAADITSYGRSATSASVRLGQKDIVNEITNANGLLGKSWAALSASVRNFPALVDWAIGEGVQEFPSLQDSVRRKDCRKVWSCFCCWSKRYS